MDHWSNWFPIVVLPLMFLVFGVCGYRAIKWHADQDKKQKEEEARAQELKK